MSTQKLCTQMFIAVLFKTVKIWNHPRCTSEGEWINQLWYTQRTECYSGLKRTESSSHEKSWRNLACILPSERTQSESITMLYDSNLEK